MPANRLPALNVGDIRGGMDVFGLDGGRIGHVTDVWLSPSDSTTPNVKEPVIVPLPPTSSPDENPDVRSDDAQQLPQLGSGDQEVLGLESGDSATIDRTSASISYFTLEGDKGPFYVPFGAVTTLFPGQNVTIDCTTSECETRFREIPR